MENCPLCYFDAQLYLTEQIKIYGSLRQIEYFVCNQCQLLFKNKASWSNENEEKHHYLQHKNTFNKDYIKPAINLMNKYQNEYWNILDYGCGPNSIFKDQLPKNHTLFSYDPIFQPNLPQQKYNLIICLEVVEHFHFPKENWDHLISFLDSNSYLLIRTELYDNKLEDLKNWYYKNDPTHINFLHSETLKYLAKFYHLELLEHDHRFHLLGKI